MDFSNVSALVIGDVMLDHYIAGSVERVSPEAPVPVINKKTSWTVPGGAANVARCLSRLGCQAKVVGLVGDDAAAAKLAHELKGDSVQTYLVKATRPTTCKTRILAQGQQLLRLDEETVEPPSFDDLVALRKCIQQGISDCNVVIISDYAKGVLRSGRHGSLCRGIIHLARERKIPVLVDPKGTDWEKYAGCQCITPNTPEFKQICAAAALPGDSSRAALATHLCEKYHLSRVLLTRGAQGMDLYEPGQLPLHLRAVRREVADVSGAGDTVIATMGACVGSGMSWSESARIANIAAGIAVGKAGTAPVEITELNQALREGSLNPRLYTSEEIVQKVADWRRSGETVVFTNGCFDLLHPGHISLLRQSAAMGDRLIVGLNSDKSVQSLKGPGRPVQNQENRALLLGALNFVDAIVIFDEETPEKLIHLVAPDFLVKGSDYQLKDVVGADFVQARGGTVRLVDIVEGCSTTGLVQKIQEGV